MDKTLFFKGSQQDGNNAKQKTEKQGRFSWKENVLEKAAERRAVMESDPLNRGTEEKRNKRFTQRKQ